MIQSYPPSERLSPGIHSLVAKAVQKITSKYEFRGKLIFEGNMFQDPHTVPNNRQ